jgi:hypothetical protein
LNGEIGIAQGYLWLPHSKVLTVDEKQRERVIGIRALYFNVVIVIVVLRANAFLMAGASPLGGARCSSGIAAGRDNHRQERS